MIDLFLVNLPTYLFLYRMRVRLLRGPVCSRPLSTTRCWSVERTSALLCDSHHFKNLLWHFYLNSIMNINLTILSLTNTCFSCFIGALFLICCIESIQNLSCFLCSEIFIHKLDTEVYMSFGCKFPELHYY